MLNLNSIDHLNPDAMATLDPQAAGPAATNRSQMFGTLELSEIDNVNQMEPQSSPGRYNTNQNKGNNSS